MGKNIKLPLEAGFATLCNHIKAIRATAEQSGSAVAALAESTAASLKEIDSLFDGKQGKAAFQTVTLPVNDWIANEDAESLAAGYAFCCDAVVAGVTAKDSAESILSYASMTAARAASMSPTSEVLGGKIRYYAVAKPAAAIILQVRPIIGGAAS